MTRLLHYKDWIHLNQVTSPSSCEMFLASGVFYRYYILNFLGHSRFVHGLWRRWCTYMAYFGVSCVKCGIYEKCVVKKTSFNHLLPVKPQYSVFFCVSEYPVSLMIIKFGPPPWPHATLLDSMKDLLKLLSRLR